MRRPLCCFILRLKRLYASPHCSSPFRLVSPLYFQLTLLRKFILKQVIRRRPYMSTRRCVAAFIYVYFLFVLVLAKLMFLLCDLDTYSDNIAITKHFNIVR